MECGSSNAHLASRLDVRELRLSELRVRLSVGLGLVDKAGPGRRGYNALKVLYKLVMGRVMKRLLKLLARYERLVDTAYGFRVEGSVEAPIEVTVKVMEHALAHKREQHRLDVDMTSAYDTVQWVMLDIAMRQLGIPEDHIDWQRAVLKGHSRIMSTAYDTQDKSDATTLLGGIP